VCVCVCVCMRRGLQQHIRARPRVWLPEQLPLTEIATTPGRPLPGALRSTTCSPEARTTRTKSKLFLTKINTRPGPAQCRAGLCAPRKATQRKSHGAIIAETRQKTRSCANSGSMRDAELEAFDVRRFGLIGVPPGSPSRSTAICFSPPAMDAEARAAAEVTACTVRE